TTMAIAYKNSDGSTGSVTTSGATTVGGLISAINGSGRGLTATFTTAAAAGYAAGGAHTGIMISGNVNTTNAPTVAGLQQITIAGGGNDTSISESAAGSLNDDSTGGIATITYTAGAGSNLSGTNLTNQGNAQSALTTLNAAIANVSAQDGYIGAQINTLNSVSSVLSTQQQNVVAAQDAVQATDYAQAASDMSKYQILSQTGISALAQANSMQREVTKLLQ
ncbi:MAG TPA: flagellin, partial [Acidobacteriaceae bacterium]